MFLSDLSFKIMEMQRSIKQRAFPATSGQRVAQDEQSLAKVWPLSYCYDASLGEHVAEEKERTWFLSNIMMVIICDSLQWFFSGKHNHWLVDHLVMWNKISEGSVFLYEISISILSGDRLGCLMISHCVLSSSRIFTWCGLIEMYLDGFILKQYLSLKTKPSWDLIGNSCLRLFHLIWFVCKTIIFKDFVPQIISGEAPLSLDSIDLHGVLF